MDGVPADRQHECLSIVNPYRPELFVRSFAVDDEILVEYDLDYNPRNPDTFDNDASFFLRTDLFFPRYDAFESVSYPRHYMTVGGDGGMKISEFQDGAEFSNAASFALPERSKWSTWLTHFHRSHIGHVSYITIYLCYFCFR